MLTRRPNTIKSRRRQGVSDLQVPSTHSDWRLTMVLDDEETGVEIFDFPQPPSPSSSRHKREPSSDSSCSSSSDSHASLSTPDTTPAASPTAANAPKGIVRCKTIKPLTINKRALSPTTPIEDEDFYASHARSFMTLSPPLPALFPSPTGRRSRSAAPTIPLPPVPTSPSRPTHSRTPSSSSSHNGHVPNFSRPTSSSCSDRDRPPPRSSLPADASTHESVWSGNFKTYYASYAPLITSNSAPSSPIRRTHTPPPPIDTLLDIPGEDSDSDEALSLSPMVATRDPDLPELDDTDGEKEQEGNGKPLPQLPPYTGWHSRPKITIQTGELRDMLRNPSPIPPTPSSSSTVTGPVLRSRWSTSTLSAASVHQREREETTSPFKLKLSARRYFSVGISSGKDKEGKNASGKAKAGKGKLTVDDVRVLLSPPEPEPIPTMTASPSLLRGAVARTQSDSGCFPSSLTKLSSDSELEFGARTGRSDLGHSRTSSADLVDDDEDDDWLLSGTGLRGRRRKPIPAFLGMHSK